MTIYQEIVGEQAWLASLRRFFHAHPELSRQEYQTAEKIERELDEIGVPHRRVDDTGVYGEIIGYGGEGPTIVLRADIDALPIQEEAELPFRSQNPGVMHACGHDMHASTLMAAARVLARRRGQFGGTVRLFFQQAEEIGYGANRFVEAGLLDGAFRVFGIHSAPDLAVGTVGVKAGPNNASVDHFTIRIKGKAAHVSTPQLGADAAYIAAQIVVAAQGIVTRCTSPTDAVILGVGKISAGTAYNIVAEEAVLEGTTRLFTPELRTSVNARLERLAKSVAELYGGEATVEWVDYASPLVNSPDVCAEIGGRVTALFGTNALITDRALSCGGDDFAEFLLQVPGAYAYVGTAAPETAGSSGPAHNSRFTIDERALPIAATLYAECAWMWLNH
ncbi:MAG: M20 family metallopeptidase [Eubacteriales bacterium]|nr:M20 family metallopeptidase [Eubacteriales bacterium]